MARNDRQKDRPCLKNTLKEETLEGEMEKENSSAPLAQGPASGTKMEPTPPLPKRPKFDLVQINVGGRHFDSSRATLRKCGYFRSMLDEDWFDGERIFVDRDGDLFHHLLAFMRSGKRPAARV